MISNLALILHYTKSNKYSFNALLGSLEKRDYFDNLKVYFFDNSQELISGISDISHNHDKVVVGISFFTTQIWESAQLVSDINAKACKNLLLIAGGPHPTGDPDGTLKMGFDIVVRGEGEETFPDILISLDRGEDYQSIQGICFINDFGTSTYTGRRPWVDLNTYPPFSVKYQKYGHIEITRGCPYGCFFCQTPQISGGFPRHRSIDNIREYVKLLVARNFKDIRFITPNAFSYGSIDGKSINMNSLESLLSSIRGIVGKRGRIFFGSFPSEVRPEHVTPETVNLVLQYADNDNIIIGAQSGSRKVLELCHRGHSLEDIYNSVEITINAGLKANVDFIFGLPGETTKGIRYTIKVMKDLIKYGAKVHAHTFMPLPQTRFSKEPAGTISAELNEAISQLVSDGLIYGDWNEQEQVAKRIAEYVQRQSSTNSTN